jgi:hypothetical protein
MSDYEFWIRAIILNNCSTEKLNLVISDYNLNGFSSNPENRTLMDYEKTMIFSQPFLQKFVSDYENWKIERENLKVMQWVKSKRVLFFFNNLIFKFAHAIRKNKNG